MKPSAPHAVTAAQWLAVLAIWSLAAYGALATPKAEGGREPMKLAACR